MDGHDALGMQAPGKIFNEPRIGEGEINQSHKSQVALVKCAHFFAEFAEIPAANTAGQIWDYFVGAVPFLAESGDRPVSLKRQQAHSLQSCVC
jgi:hypothetical protein